MCRTAPLAASIAGLVLAADDDGWLDVSGRARRLRVERADFLAAGLVGEVDAPLSSYPAHGPHPPTSQAGVVQAYVAALVTVSFDVRPSSRSTSRVPSNRP